MENISFVMWIILWPLSITLESYMEGKITGKWRKPTDGLVSFVFLSWVVIAVLLYK